MKTLALLLVLYDSTGPLACGWGYAVLVEAAGRRILFDAGANPTLLERNARTRGVDLSTLDFVVLSHRHDDHIQGLAAVVKANPDVKVYIPNEEFGVFGVSPLNALFAQLTTLPARLRPSPNPAPNAKYARIDRTTEVAPGVRIIATATSELRELALQAGPLLVSGCSHAGIERVLAACPTPPQVVAGGLHLADAGPSEVERVTAALRRRVARVAPGHCTGLAAVAALKKAFGDRGAALGAGESVSLLP